MVDTKEDVREVAEAIGGNDSFAGEDGVDRRHVGAGVEVYVGLADGGGAIRERGDGIEIEVAVDYEGKGQIARILIVSQRQDQVP